MVGVEAIAKPECGWLRRVPVATIEKYANFDREFCADARAHTRVMYDSQSEPERFEALPGPLIADEPLLKHAKAELAGAHRKCLWRKARATSPWLELCSLVLAQCTRSSLRSHYTYYYLLWERPSHSLALRTEDSLKLNCLGVEIRERESERERERGVLLDNLARYITNSTVPRYCCCNLLNSFRLSLISRSLFSPVFTPKGFLSAGRSPFSRQSRTADITTPEPRLS